MSLKEDVRKAQTSTGEDGKACLRMTIPTGRIQEKVLILLDRVGLKVSNNGRSYRPACSEPGIEIKMLKRKTFPASFPSVGMTAVFPAMTGLKSSRQM